MKMSVVKKVVLFVAFQFLFGTALAPFLLFWGPFNGVKAFAVGSVVTSRHPQYIKLFLTDDEVKQILSKAENEAASSGTVQEAQTTKVVNTGGITIEEIKGRSFRGKVMLVKDPLRVEVAITSSIGETGERVSDLARKANAVGAVNAGGFNDPNGKGNGAFPMGIVIHEGKVISDDSNGGRQELIGIDSQGKLIVQLLSAEEAKAKGMKEAINFFPQLVSEGKGLVKGDGGWGIGPRTAIGQLPDGTIMFVVIDGRQIHSLGATLRDLQQIFLNHGAVTAANLDGGSSTTMFYNGSVINKPADVFGERYVPTAFVVKP